MKLFIIQSIRFDIQKLAFLSIFAFLCLHHFSACAQPSSLELQKKIQNSIKKTYSASVFIAEYDTISKQTTGSRFSGVVVSSDGLILTAAHVGVPNRSYLVVFPDGTERVALGLGALTQFDAAVLKIKNQGKWPFAEIGWSSSLKINDPCVSIAYPGSFNPMRSVVRFGYVKNVLESRKNMLQTTCLMEPGDSGGPVFDIYGRVIGIHSNIDMELDRNFEVPIDVFRKYWYALQRPITYSSLPMGERIEPDTLKTRLWNEKQFTEVQTELAKLETALDKFTVKINDPTNSTISAIGTVVSLTKLGINDKKGKSYVITKASLIKPGMTMSSGMGVPKPFVEIYRDDKRDMVLLEVAMTLKDKLDISANSQDSIRNANLGELLISPNPENEGQTSVIGYTTFELVGLSGRGYLGTNLISKNGHNIIEGVQQESPASKGGLLAGDELLKVNKDTITGPEMLPKMISSRKPGEIVNLFVIRNDKPVTLEITLGSRIQYTSDHIAERFTDGKSKRLDGFSNAFVHDSKLKPNECGGPVFDLDGRLIGMNMARYSRTSSIAVTTKEIVNFIKDFVLKAK